jgi:hypothetical protein
MSQGPSEPGPTVSVGPGDDEDRPRIPAREQVTRPMERPVLPAHQQTEAVPTYQPTVPADAVPPHPPTAVAPPHPPTEVAPRRQDPASFSSPTVIAPQARPYSDPREQPTVMPAGAFAPPAPMTNIDPSRPPAPYPAAAAPPPSELVRYGPGVPPSQASVSAEQVWRTGQIPTPPKRPVRFRALASLALTVILLAAAGVLLFLRFHHSPFKVSGVPTFSTAQNGCTVNVTGQIPTNGSSGTISYQWVFTPQQAAPQPLSQSVVSGQHDVFVTVAVQGQGHGTASEQVTLQVLGPNQESASSVVKVSC